MKSSIRSKQRPRFRNARERSLWLLAIAAAAAVFWAIAKVLEWPLGVQAALAGLAALAVVAIPEIRLRLARGDKITQTLSRLPLPDPGKLPLTGSLPPKFFGVHEAHTTVPYIDREAQRVVEPALKAREPLLIVGHSMAGKTRLAAEGLKKILPNAPLLPPTSTSVLRTLVEDGMKLDGVVVWLDDLENYLKGENGLDLALLDRILAAGAIVVATIRRNEMNAFRPKEDDNPEQWKVIQRFRQAPLARKFTDDEVAVAKAKIADPKVTEAMDRYGLAEYLGGGPDAVELFEDGEITQPVGYSLVRAAVDWRRAGLVRPVSGESLQKALPGYLEQRPDVSTSNDAIDSGLKWATDRVNETVALLGLRESRGIGDVSTTVRSYEAFDYLVDVIVDRNIASKNREFPIPIPMWEIATKEASAEERSDVARAVDRYFVPRPAVMAQLAAWLSAPADSVPAGALVTGMGGSGKTTVLFQLREMWARLVAPGGLGGTVPSPPRNLVPRSMYSADIGEMDTEGLRNQLCEMLEIAPLAPDPGTSRERSSREFANYLRSKSAGRNGDYLIALDNLDDSRDSDSMWELLRAICSPGAAPNVRIVVASRRRDDHEGWLVIDVSRMTEEELLASIMPQLTQAYSENPTLLDDVARKIAALFGDNFFTASLATDIVIKHGAAGLDEIASKSSEEYLFERLSASISRNLDRLGDGRELSVRLMKVLSERPLPAARVELLQEVENLGVVDGSDVALLLEQLCQFGLLERSSREGDASEDIYSVDPIVRRLFIENPTGQ